MGAAKAEVFSTTSGQITATTSLRPVFESAYVSINTRTAEENIEITFYENYGSRYSQRSLSFGINRKITSGIYPYPTGAMFYHAGYMEVVNYGASVRPHQYEVTSGLMTINVTEEEPGQRSYVVEKFTLTAKSPSGKSREIIGSFSVFEEDE